MLICKHLLCYLLSYIQRDALASETAELDTQQQQLDDRWMKLDNQVAVLLISFYLVDMLTFLLVLLIVSMYPFFEITISVSILFIVI